MDKPDVIDTTNRCMIASWGDDLIFMRAPGRVSKAQALVIAAYIVSMVGDDEAWQQTLDAVQNT
jgi:hypothetical protein